MATTTHTGPPAPGGPPSHEDSARHDFAALYERWFNDVCRWLRAMGGAERELEDLAQEVFLVARRKFAGFDGASAPAWLYGIAWRVAADARRRAWFRHWQGSDERHGVEPAGGDPVEALERREARRLLHTLLGQMGARRRTVLVLAEIEGYSAAQIAELEGVKVATIWTRLHHARRELLKRVETWERAEKRRAGGTMSADEPRLRDAKAADGVTAARTAALLRADEPLDPPAAWKERVRGKVLLAPAGAPVWGRVGGLGWVAAAVVGGTVAAILAWAALDRHDGAPSQRALPPAPTPPAAAAAPSPPGLAPPAAATLHVVAAPPAVAPPQVVPMTPQAPRPPRRVSINGADPLADPAQSEGAALVLGALTALNRDHQPARAVILVDDYLARYPRGPLGEEALKIAIDAALADGGTGAVAYARRYLERYPSGRFAGPARSVLQSKEKPHE